jgi:hypothetical protein
MPLSLPLKPAPVDTQTEILGHETASRFPTWVVVDDSERVVQLVPPLDVTSSVLPSELPPMATQLPAAGQDIPSNTPVLIPPSDDWVRIFQLGTEL